ncbi:kinase-like domain-containing protein [Suillus spraguei]|nr:kinase-like domain-containing protein [Suillus spraguei]
MFHIFCLKPGGVIGLWHYLSDIIQEKSTEVPRTYLSDVYRCTMVSKSHGKIEVAIKSLRILDLSEEATRALRKRIYGEVRAWAALHHKNVLHFFGTTSGFGPLPHSDKFILLEQITAAIQYLHDKHHNILIDSRGSAHVTDFGLSMVLAECDSSSIYTLGCAELINLTDDEAGKPTTYSDVYSLGSVILLVLSGKVPYYWLEDPLHIMAARHKVDRRHVPFLQKCWSRSSDRPTIDHVLSYVRSALPPS